MPVGAMNLQEGGQSFSKRSGYGLFPSWHISRNWALWKSSKGNTAAYIRHPHQRF